VVNPSLKFLQDVSEHSTFRSPSSYENFLVAGLFEKELPEGEGPSPKKCRISMQRVGWPNHNDKTG
jgi:hypothetical protein